MCKSVQIIFMPILYTPWYSIMPMSLLTYRVPILFMICILLRNRVSRNNKQIHFYIVLQDVKLISIYEIRIRDPTANKHLNWEKLYIYQLSCVVSSLIICQYINISPISKFIRHFIFIITSRIMHRTSSSTYIYIVVVVVQINWCVQHQISRVHILCSNLKIIWREY
jgi:hypothetical protein